MAYKVAELKFFNMKKKKIWVESPRNRNGLSVFEIEDKLTEDEKIAFMDELKDGIGTYLFHLLVRWEKEKETLPKDAYGKPKTVSKKAWIKRNDPKQIMNQSSSLGKYTLFKTSYKDMSTLCPSTEYGYSMEHTGKLIIHQWFHDCCEELYWKEKEYFEKHDPKEIKLAKVKEYGDKYHMVFDNQDLNDVVWNRKKDVSEERLDAFIAAYEEVEEKIQAITKALNV